MTDKSSPVSITPQQLVSLRRDARHIKLAKGKIRARQSGAHMSKLRVKVGQRVSRGQHIGDMGASGRVTGVHLHYEVRRYGKTMDPLGFVNLGPKLRKFL